MAKVVVQAASGARYPCRPGPDGTWHCGRCTMGQFPAAPGRRPGLGSRCTVCGAEVVPPDARGVPRLAWTILGVLLLLLLAWAIWQHF